MFSGSNHVELVTFDGSSDTSFGWKLLNDPVMGGVSNSTWTIDTSNKWAHWIGDCNIVPSLQAPGFCNAETTNPYTTKFNDASGFTHLQIKIRSQVDYKGFKVSFAANTFNPQFKCFKADFDVVSDGSWNVVSIPFNSFSNDWSPSTGEPNKKCSEHPEVCPDDHDLKKIQTIGFWMEGVEGHFEVDIDYVRAGYAHDFIESSRPVTIAYSVGEVRGNYTCDGPIQANLKYNMSTLMWDEDNHESLTEGICCDSAYAGFAEPPQTFEFVHLFEIIKNNEMTTFYDPICGLPLFTAPQGRTFDSWKAESEHHGWPSFRKQEAIMENLKFDSNGVVFSTCGTRLGDNLPDDTGDRYCLDLACLAGNKINGHVYPKGDISRTKKQKKIY